MPTIIGAQDNGQAKTLADAFSRFADSTWGSGAQSAALRNAQTQEAQQRAYQLSDQNRREADLQKSLEAGIDPRDPHQLALAVATGKIDKLQAARLYQTANTAGATAPVTQAAQIGAGQSYGNTFGDAAMKDATTRRGQDIGLKGTMYSADSTARTAERGQDITKGTTERGQDITAGTARDVEKMRGENAQQTELLKQGAEIIQVPDPTSPSGFRNVTRAQAAGMPGAVGSDVVKGMVLGQSFGLGGPQAPQQPALPNPSFDGTALPTPPGLMGGQSFPVQAPNGNNLTATVARPQPTTMSDPTTWSPDQRSMMGLPTGHTEFLHPETGEHGVSQDGGQTIVTDSGQRVPVAGSGFAAVGGPTAFTDVQAMNARRDVLQNPDFAEPTPQTSQVMSDLANLPPGAARDAAGLLNGVAGLTGLNAFLPGGEVGADTNRAAQRLAIFNNQMKRAFKNSEAFGVKEQRSVDDLLPGNGIFTNPVTESKKLPELYKFLADQRSMLRQQIKSVPAAEIPKVLAALQDNAKAMKMLTSPKWGSGDAGAPAPTQGGGVPAPAAPQAPAGGQADPLGIRG